MAKKTWNKTELKEFKKIIVHKRQTVLQNIEEARERADDIINQGNQSSIYSSHMADAGSDQQSLEHAYSIINRESSMRIYSRTYSPNVTTICRIIKSYIVSIS